MIEFLKTLQMSICSMSIAGRENWEIALGCVCEIDRVIAILSGEEKPNEGKPAEEETDG